MSKKLVIPIDEHFHTALKVYSSATGKSISETVRQATQEYLARNAPGDDFVSRYLRQLRQKAE